MRKLIPGASAVGARDPCRTIGRNGPVSRAAAHLQAGMDALPLAAAALCLQDGNLSFVARNALFARLVQRNPAAELADEIVAALHVFFDRFEPVNFAWEEPGVGGRHYHAHISRLMDDAHDGSPRALLTLLDRTAEVATQRSLRFEMLHDSLTGLPNRLSFTEKVDACIEADGETGGFAVLALDLKRFSRINESIGALAGDELIITVARRLISAMRVGDTLARMAGDEFGVLVCLIDGPGDALHVARRLQNSLIMPLHLCDLEIRVDCAIGCAVWHEQAPSSADVMRNAQFALKRAKQSGRIEVYKPGDAGKARRRFSLETELRRAIDTDQMSLAFQPLIELTSNRVAGFEVLARWNHPDHGPIPPGEFIPVAEESGLIVPLGRSVLDRAIRTLANWDAKAGRRLPIYFGVNVSPVQLARDSMAEAVEATLAAYGVDGARLTLELTESSIIADPTRASGVLRALKGLSCRIAMDDFGTGYSSLAYLQRLPIDILKIDRQFVTDMVENSDSTAIVRAILSLATALNMSTIAEGIETAQGANMLRALGCHVGQGFHFARPMPADEALAYLLDRPAVAA